MDPVLSLVLSCWEPLCCVFLRSAAALYQISLIVLAAAARGPLACPKTIDFNKSSLRMGIGPNFVEKFFPLLERQEIFKSRFRNIRQCLFREKPLMGSE